MLEDRGYHVQTVASARDGAGEDVIRAARQRAADTRIIVVTGVSDPERLRKVVELGPTVMMKPVAGEQLLQAMGGQKPGTA